MNSHIICLCLFNFCAYFELNFHLNALNFSISIFGHVFSAIPDSICAHTHFHVLSVIPLLLQRERIKQEALLVKQKEHAEQVRERRDRVEKRIEMNSNMVERIDEKRKTDFVEKQEHFERIRETHLQQQEQERCVLDYCIWCLLPRDTVLNT